LLPKGTFVIQYIGEVYSLDSEYGMKKLEEYKNNTCTYLMSLSKNEVIDPTNKGNMARFINHSCEPNCETQKWNVLGEVCVGIFTLRDIQPDEELTFDYGFNIMKTIFQRCLCGSVSCRGYLGIAIEKDKKKMEITSFADFVNNIANRKIASFYAINVKKFFIKIVR
jgi:histone-lysine N-methyltransferase SETD2/UMP-CMP kinase